MVFEEDAVLGQANDFNISGCMRHYKSGSFPNNVAMLFFIYNLSL
jgi:hypothetical protein